jgi:hypothetical protein
MLALPLYIYVSFFATVAFGVYLWTVVTRKSVPALVIVVLWLAVQALISLSGFYTNTAADPPRFPALILLPMMVIALLFVTKRGREWIDSSNTRKIYLVHLVRIPVELLLYSLYINKAVPELMTFSGINFDILSGITAPVLYYFGVIKQALPRFVMLLWNLVCLALLANIVYHAVFAAPLPFQKFGFEQPNIAVLYFPFTWLPAFIVPFVFFAHLVSIRQLVTSQTKQKFMPNAIVHN